MKKNSYLTLALAAMFAAFLAAPASAIDQVSCYTGQLAGEPIQLLIEWEFGGRIYGVIAYRGREIPFVGENTRAGRITFTDGDGDFYCLNKILTPTRIIWSGTIASNRGVGNVVFSRAR